MKYYSFKCVTLKQLGTDTAAEQLSMGKSGAQDLSGHA